jgi:hypothetical protein
MISPRPLIAYRLPAIEIEATIAPKDDSAAMISPIELDQTK